MNITLDAVRALVALARMAAVARDPLAGGAALDPAAARLLRDLRAAAPKRTGAYAASIRVAREGRALRAYGPQPLTDYLIRGTRPHPILPRTALALYWAGAAHPVKSVNHPGTRPNPFARQAGEAAAGELKRTLGQYVIGRFRDALG